MCITYMDLCFVLRSSTYICSSILLRLILVISILWNYYQENVRVSQRNSQSSDYRNCDAEKQRSRKRCQAVLKSTRVREPCQPGGSLFSLLCPIKIENYAEQTLRHLHKSTYWIDGCVSNPSSRADIREALPLDVCSRVHARRHFQIARPCRSIAVSRTISRFLDRSIDRASEFSPRVDWQVDNYKSTKYTLDIKIPLEYQK